MIELIAVLLVTAAVKSVGESAGDAWVASKAAASNSDAGWDALQSRQDHRAARSQWRRSAADRAAAALAARRAARRNRTATTVGGTTGPQRPGIRDYAGEIWGDAIASGIARHRRRMAERDERAGTTTPEPAWMRRMRSSAAKAGRILIDPVEPRRTPQDQADQSPTGRTQQTCGELTACAGGCGKRLYATAGTTCYDCRSPKLVCKFCGSQTQNHDRRCNDCYEQRRSTAIDDAAKREEQAGNAQPQGTSPAEPPATEQSDNWEANRAATDEAVRPYERLRDARAEDQLNPWHRNRCRTCNRYVRTGTSWCAAHKPERTPMMEFDAMTSPTGEVADIATAIAAADALSKYATAVAEVGTNVASGLVEALESYTAGLAEVGLPDSSHAVTSATAAQEVTAQAAQDLTSAMAAVVEALAVVKDEIGKHASGIELAASTGGLADGQAYSG